MKKTRGYISAREASRHLGIAQRSLRQRYADGRIAGRKTSSGVVEILASEVDKPKYDLSEKRDTDPAVAKLEAAYHATLRKLDEAKNKHTVLVRATREAIFEAAEEIKIMPPRFETFPVIKKGADDEECLVLLSDWQLGKRTPTYNSDVCEQRIKLLAKKILLLIGKYDARVKRIVLCCAGDMVEGEGIFATQAHAIDSGMFRQAVVNGPRILGGLILTLLAAGFEVHVIGVIGNHGSIRLANGPADPESNMDRILYETVRLMLMGHEDAPSAIAKSGRLTWSIPMGAGERNWKAVHRIGDIGFLVAHGDQIKGGFAGFPFYGAAKKSMGWIDGIREPWDFLLVGHWHTPTSLTFNYRQFRCNGSTESGNDYALEQLAALGTPTQWMALVHPKKGVTAEWWIHLDEVESSVHRARRQAKT